jgi:hypothetical protein
MPRAGVTGISAIPRVQRPRYEPFAILKPRDRAPLTRATAFWLGGFPAILSAFPVLLVHDAQGSLILFS